MFQQTDSRLASPHPRLVRSSYTYINYDERTLCLSRAEGRQLLDSPRLDARMARGSADSLYEEKMKVNGHIETFKILEFSMSD